MWVMQWDGTDDVAEALRRWTGGRFERIAIGTGDDPEADARVLDALHATWVLLRTGDWIIRGIEGEFYPCRGPVFDDTYDLLSPIVVGDH